jgi:hypothetical protein
MGLPVFAESIVAISHGVDFPRYYRDLLPARIATEFDGF